MIKENIEALKQLIDKYQRFYDGPASSKDSHVMLKQLTTFVGIGSKSSCIVCQSVQGDCKKCFWNQIEYGKTEIDYKQFLPYEYSETNNKIRVNKHWFVNTCAYQTSYKNLTDAFLKYRNPNYIKREFIWARMKFIQKKLDQNRDRIIQLYFKGTEDEK